MSSFVPIQTQLPERISFKRWASLSARTYRLISAVAANGPASAVIALASESWVESIEPDQEVKAL